MVCPRCISSVAVLLDKLKMEYEELNLGNVVLKKVLSKKDKTELSEQLVANGFELLGNSKDDMVNQIKSILIEKIHCQESISPFSLSELLTSQIYKDYSVLSKTFSKVEGITIEQYVILQKIERAKELLSYNQLSISEIAIKIGYSSTAHFSRQFKQVTHLTPSQYKKNTNKQTRQSIDLL